MPKKTFEGFKKFLAADANTFLMDQSVMSFANSTDRTSALPTPTDGMASWLQDTDSFTIYNGSSWVNPAPQQTLVLLGTQTFSSVTAASINSVFSSSYTSYKLVYVTTLSTGGDVIRARVRASGSDLTTNTYRVGEYYVGANSNVAPANQNNGTQAFIPIGVFNAGSNFVGEIDIYNPFTTTNTRVTSRGVGGTLHWSGGVVLNTISYDGFTLTSGSVMSGTMTVYGIKES